MHNCEKYVHCFPCSLPVWERESLAHTRALGIVSQFWVQPRMHLNRESQNTRGFYHLKSATGNILNGQRKKSIRWQLYLVCGSSLPEGPCWTPGVHSMSWCNPWSLSLCCPPERMAGNRFPGEIKPVHQPPALIFSLLNARPPTWISMPKDVVLVLLRRQLTAENTSFLGCVGGSSQAHLDGNVQFWEKCPFIHLYRNNYRCMQPYNGDMQRSAQINANCVFILIQEKSSSMLHFPFIFDSNCAPKHVSWTGWYTWAGAGDIFQL